MKYRAIIKQSDGWWIGWLLDLPGVNAQEKTRRRLIESLRMGALEMLAAQVPFEQASTMLVVDIPDPDWAAIPAQVPQPTQPLASRLLQSISSGALHPIIP